MNKFLLVVCIAVLVAISLLDVGASKEILIGILGTVTFLFGIITVSAINDRQKRMASIRDENSVVRAEIFQLYQLSSIWGKKFQDETRKLIDDYLVAIFMYKMEDQHMTNSYFQKLHSHFMSIEVQDKKQVTAFSSINIALDSFVRARTQINALIQDSLPKMELILSALLGALIAVSLLVINTGSVFSIVTVGTLILVLIFSMRLLLSLEKLDYSYEDRIVEPYQQTFEEIGLMRYYPEPLIKKGSLRYVPKDRPYREGVFKNPYPDMTGAEIVIVEPETGDPS